MREKRKSRYRYKTHPLVGALLALSMMVTLATSAAAYAEWRYIDNMRRAYRERYEKCALESYITMCEAIKNGDAKTAADALSRCELYCGEGEFSSLRARILSNDIVGIDIDGIAGTDSIIRAAGDGGKNTVNADVASLIAGELRRADRKSRGSDGGENVSAAVYSAGWETLKNKLEISSDDALGIARDAIGGGALLHAAENHTFPVVYTFTCKNGAAEVTRSGGRLLRMYMYRHGTAEARGADVCRQRAEDFVSDAGLRDCILVGEDKSDGGEYRYTFCGTFYYGGYCVTVPDETVTVTVDENGAAVCGFDASEYYRCRKISYDLPKYLPSLPEGGNTRGGLCYSGGELFWSESGVKTPVFAEK